MDVIFFLITYAIIINIVGFALMKIDKRKAIKHAFRIPESTLFIIAIIGGSIGCLIGMYVCRHKTRHWYFVYGMPLILAVQILLLILLNILPIKFITI